MACSRYPDAYVRPFHFTPWCESTFHADVNIIAPNTEAPSGVVSEYQVEIPILWVTTHRVYSIYVHTRSDSPITTSAIPPPPLRYQKSPNQGQAGKNSDTTMARNAPKIPRVIKEG